MHQNVVLLNEVGMSDLPFVGGKNASLGEMIQNLTRIGVNIPAGFVITVNAYQEFVDKWELRKQGREL